MKEYSEMIEIQIQDYLRKNPPEWVIKYVSKAQRNVQRASNAEVGSSNLSWDAAGRMVLVPRESHKLTNAGATLPPLPILHKQAGGRRDADNVVLAEFDSQV